MMIYNYTNKARFVSIIF